MRLSRLRQGAQALILLGVGIVLAVAAAAARPLPASWRAVGVAAGALITVPGLLRQLAFHRAWGAGLIVFFLAIAVVGVA